MAEQTYTLRFLQGRLNARIRCDGCSYTVRQGDTMYLIAQRFGIPLNILIAANPQISDPNIIIPGQIICIPSSYPPVCTGKGYMVQSGDTLFLIAKRFGVPLNVLIAANPQIKNPDVLRPGQVICIPESYPPACSGRLYVIQSGDTLYLISQRFAVPLNTLIEANPQITNPDVIYPGQIICIPMM